MMNVIEAGKALAEEVKLAYLYNRNREFITQIPCKIKADTDLIVNEVLLIAKLEEVSELIPKKALFSVRPSLGSLIHVDFPQRPDAYNLKVEWDGDILTLNFVIYGASLDFRWQYDYNDCTKRNLQDLLDKVENLNEEEKVRKVAKWVVSKIELRTGILSEEVDVSQQAIYNGTAIGDDETLAEVYLFYASLVGLNTDHYLIPNEPDDWDYRKSFFWNVVRIGGKEYCLDMVKMSEFYEEGQSVIFNPECELILTKELRDLDKYRAWAPVWRTQLPFSNVSPV